MAGPLPFQQPNQTDLYNLYGGPYSSGYQGLMRERVGQTQQLADLYVGHESEDLRHKQTMNPMNEVRVPLELESLNQDVIGKTRKNKDAAQRQDLEYEAFVREHKGKIQQQHLDELNQTGQILSQIGAQVRGIQDPVMRNLKAKELFKKYGFEDRYDDSVDAGQLYEIGQAMLTANPKAAQAFGVQSQKDEAAAERLRQSNIVKERIAQIQAQARRAVASVQKLSPEQQPKSYQALSVKWSNLAAQAAAAGNQEDAQYYTMLSQQAVATAAQLLQVQASARNTGQVDAGAVSNLPTVPPPATPTVPQAPVRQSGAPQANPATATRPLRQAVMEAGYPYEPEKYDYRIDPQTGKAQRKLKQ